MKENKLNVKPHWLSTNPSKRWGEQFFLYYSIAWMSFFGFIVVSKTYEHCGNFGYTLIGLIVALPAFFWPLLFPNKVDYSLPISQRYWFKANIWIAIISFIGNYFWTHYFYVVLRARYTFPTTWELNKVPIYLYLITHAYFCSYHTFAGLLLRRFRTSSFYRTTCSSSSNKICSFLVCLALNSMLVFGMGFVIAFMEAFTISSVPYYTYPDRFLMWTVGSMFYGIYFYVSFPMFYRLDELPSNDHTHSAKAKQRWTVSQTFWDALAACMLVTVLLDFWRLLIGSITDQYLKINVAENTGVPFTY